MTSRRKTVLVTDDNEDLLDIFAFVLGQEGCNVVTAADGAQAVEKASLSRPDLILMDLHMPVMDGYEATRKIKFMPQLSRVPVIAISAQCDGNWKRRALEAGCMECVSKPLDADKLHSIVERYIGNCETDSARLQ